MTTHQQGMSIKTAPYPRACSVETASYPGSWGWGHGRVRWDQEAVAYDTVQTSPYRGLPAPRLGTNYDRTEAATGYNMISLVAASVGYKAVGTPVD